MNRVLFENKCREDVVVWLSSPVNFWCFPLLSISILSWHSIWQIWASSVTITTEYFHFFAFNETLFIEALNLIGKRISHENQRSMFDTFLMHVLSWFYRIRNWCRAHLYRKFHLHNCIVVIVNALKCVIPFKSIFYRFQFSFSGIMNFILQSKLFCTSMNFFIKE